MNNGTFNPYFAKLDFRFIFLPFPLLKKKLFLPVPSRIDVQTLALSWFCGIFIPSPGTFADPISEWIDCISFPGHFTRDFGEINIILVPEKGMSPLILGTFQQMEWKLYIWLNVCLQYQSMKAHT